MATFYGTTKADNLIGTDDADLLVANGVGGYGVTGYDYLSGRRGSDVYQLSTVRKIGSYNANHKYVIDDAGDGAADKITGLSALTQAGSFGSIAYTQAERVGNDLHIVTAGRADAYRSTGIASVDIVIKNHYVADGSGTVEFLTAGATTYSLSTGNLGTAGADLMAGTALDDTFSSGDGNDYVIGNDGNDTLTTGAGLDEVFGGNGSDTIFSGADADKVYAGAGNDTVYAGTGNDLVELGDGDDIAYGEAGADILRGGNGNDLLNGGSGADTLDGGAGNDTLTGGTGSDVYTFGGAAAGHDRVVDQGDAADVDTIDVVGLYGASVGSQESAFSRLGFERVGEDMVVSVDNGLATITVAGQFATNGVSADAVEQVRIDGTYWSGPMLKVESANLGSRLTSDLNEVLFGTGGADKIFGGLGDNFIWTGSGADTLVYKEMVLKSPLYNSTGSNTLSSGRASDIVMDFDTTQDHLDFSEIAGLTFDDLTVSSNAGDNAVVSWSPADPAFSSIQIELRGVTAAEVNADLFLFG